MNAIDLTTIKTIHCIGIGGIGVSGIAELLQQKGYRVSGSDIASSAVTDRLKKFGIVVSIGHRAENINNADLVIYSSAIDPSNPERIAAQSQGIALISRGQMLAQLMQGHFNIVVVGTHGKTTTTGCIAH